MAKPGRRSSLQSPGPWRSPRCGPDAT
jgi:hypothetical protein